MMKPVSAVAIVAGGILATLTAGLLFAPAVARQMAGKATRDEAQWFRSHGRNGRRPEWAGAFA